ncbi:MAG: S8 family serine peptidase [Bacteroidetes bacterium]|nr:S8 family serine peptidase [Bacteroidota bacterium]
MKFKILTLTLLTLIGLNVKGQVKTLVNKISESITGQSDTGKIAPLRKVNNTYVVSSNQKISTTQNDFKTTALNGNVTSLWAQLYNASNKKALTTAMTSDNNGNIYIAGTTFINSSNSQDLTVIKYNAQGQQKYVKHYNGPGNNYDVASGIVTDNNGNVYVTGASIGNFPSFLDYVTLKLDSMGITQWTSRYNFSNGMDIPTDLLLDNSGNVIVSGSSASSSMNNNSDFTTVKYNATTGAQMAVQRQNNPGTAKDMVTAQTKDANGNIYTTGTTSSDGINYNVQTIKYDANMNPVWVKTFDPYGKYDTGSDIEVDNLGNVIVTGYATKTNLAKMLMVLSYNSSGNLNWKALKDVNGEGVKVVIKSSNEIFIGGNININGNQDMAILRYNNTGGQNLEKIYNGASNLKDQLLDMLVDGNFIVVSGLTNNGTIDQNVTIKYEYKDFTVIKDSTNTGMFFNKNEIIVTFYESVLKMTTINNRNVVFGNLNDFVADSTCLKIQNLVDNGSGEILPRNFTTRKIFERLIQGDSLSVTRLGDTIKVPHFYSMLAISLPGTINTKLVADTLNTIKPDIFFSHLNYLTVANSVPNDPNYNSLQASLHPTSTYPSAHINCEPAWDFTTGQPHVRVGVYDNGIDDSNADLSGVLVGGVDLTNNGGYNVIYNNNGHGTAVAGIIAGKLNNSTGISGIAGGDGSISQPGVSLYSMKRQHNTFATMADTYNAIEQGASGANLNGQALNIMNHSWGLNNPSYDYDMVRVLNYANNNGVAIVASRGNQGTTDLNAPATTRPPIVMCVGATGYDGHYQNGTNGDSYSSSYGGPLDFVAPGTSQIVNTTGVGVNNYGSFTGTSASAPHVAGITALLMSYKNYASPNWSNLTHEDCENLIRRTCTDLAQATPYGESIGYDSKTGSGRVNAGAALNAIASPKYNIRHIDPNHYVSSSSTVFNFVQQNVSSTWQGYGAFPLGVGLYDVDIIEAVTTLNYTLPSNEIYVGSWPLYKASKGAPLYSGIISPDDESYVEIVGTPSTSQAVLRTYLYHIKNLTGAPINSTNMYYPNVMASITSAFSLYTENPTISVNLNKITSDTKYFNVYPNPSNGQFIVGFSSEKNTIGKLKVIDVAGRTIYEESNLNVLYGVNRINVATSALVSGIYFVNLEIEGNKSLVKKLIIQ